MPSSDTLAVPIRFYSFFRELTGCAQTVETVAAGGTVADLLQLLYARFPKLAPLRRSTLVAVGVEYQKPDYVLRAGDEVSLFPPVQGG